MNSHQEKKDSKGDFVLKVKSVRNICFKDFWYTKIDLIQKYICIVYQFRLSDTGKCWTATQRATYRYMPGIRIRHLLPDRCESFVYIPFKMYNVYNIKNIKLYNRSRLLL